MITSSILICGSYMPLLNSRAAVLGQAGYRVATAAGWKDARANESIDLMILCHTLSEQERAITLQAVAEKWPSVRRLCLTPVKGSTEGATDFCNSFEGPAKLVNTVRKLLIQQGCHTGLTSVPASDFITAPVSGSETKPYERDQPFQVP